jgi:hypothetical protein
MSVWNAATQFEHFHGVISSSWAHAHFALGAAPAALVSFASLPGAYALGYLMPPLHGSIPRGWWGWRLSDNDTAITVIREEQLLTEEI